jgi:uncharacterized protein YjiS (DUF1127 family)
MAAIDSTRSLGSHGLVGRIGALLSALIAAFVDWNDARATRNALSALSDRELEDIGMVRGDIESVARNGGVF